MKREYSKHGDVLTFKFHVPGWSQDQINALVGEIVCQAEANDDHPEAVVIEQSVEQLDVDQERRDFASDEDDEDAEADYWRDSERDYDPDEDRTP